MNHINYQTPVNHKESYIRSNLKMHLKEKKTQLSIVQTIKYLLHIIIQSVHVRIYTQFTNTFHFIIIFLLVPLRLRCASRVGGASFFAGPTSRCSSCAQRCACWTRTICQLTRSTRWRSSRTAHDCSATTRRPRASSGSECTVFMLYNIHYTP